MIDLGFDATGDLTSVSTDGFWWVSYFLHGQYVLSTSEAPGIYQVVEEGGVSNGWSTTLDVPNPLSQVLTDQTGILAFDRIGLVNDASLAASTPEPATFLMLAMGLACMSLFGFRRKRRYSRHILA